MIKKITPLITLLVLCFSTYSAWALLDKKVDERWSNYKTWTKGNKTLITGPSFALGKLHKGPEGFRNIYINDIGAAMYNSDGPYNYPEGTIVVKEQYSNMKNVKKGKHDTTIMVKLAKGASPETGDWGYATKLTGKVKSGTSGDAKFCGGCHRVAAQVKQGDYLFTNKQFHEEK